MSRVFVVIAATGFGWVLGSLHPLIGHAQAAALFLSFALLGLAVVFAGGGGDR